MSSQQKLSIFGSNPGVAGRRRSRAIGVPPLPQIRSHRALEEFRPEAVRQRVDQRSLGYSDDERQAIYAANTAATLELLKAAGVDPSEPG